ncbi:MAG: hypothetical protein JO340_13370 [Acidobacteriaceae bacterium]|nr:hypothetical protein [Acidobacteriaceae bacterium]
MRLSLLLLAILSLPALGLGSTLYPDATTTVSPGRGYCDLYKGLAPLPFSCNIQIGGNHAIASVGVNGTAAQRFPSGAVISGAGATGVLGESTYTSASCPTAANCSPYVYAEALIDWQSSPLSAFGAAGAGTLTLHFAYDASAIQNGIPDPALLPTLFAGGTPEPAQTTLSSSTLGSASLTVPVDFGTPFLLDLQLQSAFQRVEVPGVTDQQYADFELTGFTLYDANGNALPNSDLHAVPEPGGLALLTLPLLGLLVRKQRHS